MVVWKSRGQRESTAATASAAANDIVGGHGLMNERNSDGQSESLTQCRTLFQQGRRNSSHTEDKENTPVG